MSGARGGIVAALVALAWGTGPVKAENIDSEHLFGFTEGTDIGDKGDKELELAKHGRFGKRQGSYGAVSGTAEGKFTIFDNFRIAPGGSVAYHSINGVPGLDDRNAMAFEGLGLEMKYRAMDRLNAPFGLTFAVTPSWARIDATSGEPIREYGVGFLASADRALVPDKVFAAVNLTYELATSRSRVTGERSRDSALGLSGALAAQICDGIYLGGEIRYARAYEGLALDRFAGHALFVGPTFYAKLSKTAWIAAGWNIQVAGHAADTPGALDLVNFERHEVKVRFGQAF
jgi:hypothetical protein